MCIRDSPTTYLLATIPHDSHCIVHYDPSRSSKVNVFHLIWQSICHFLLNCNLDPILHCLATIHPWQTDRQTDRQTDGWTDDDNNDNSSTFTKVQSINKIIYVSNLMQTQCMLIVKVANDRKDYDDWNIEGNWPFLVRRLQQECCLPSKPHPFLLELFHYHTIETQFTFALQHRK